MTEEKKFKFNLPKLSKRSRLLFIALFCLAIVLIFATYAWFSASLNVKIKFFDVKVSTDTGLFISLDGVNFSDSVEISRDSVIDDLYELYPNHTNQWANNGLWSVSSNGIPNSNSSKFAIFNGEMGKYMDKERRGQRYLVTSLLNENKPNDWSQFIAFDVFLKNVSGSPKKDNLYLTRNTFVEFDEEADEETIEKMTDIMNSMRIGVVYIGETSSKSDIKTIQNLQCNNQCKSFIYEPNSLFHNDESIKAAKKYDIELINNSFVPTYGVISEGIYLDHKSGFANSGVSLDTEHFALQNTLKDDDLEAPLFQIPNGITKVRIYVWLEGQDIDALEVHSEGAPVDLNLEFEKDLAGYNNL